VADQRVEVAARRGVFVRVALVPLAKRPRDEWREAADEVRKKMLVA
jgi:hypothetical protein